MHKEETRPVRVVAAIALVMVVSGCARTAASVKAAVHPPGDAEHLAGWLARHPLAADQEMSVAELGRTQGSSLHMVQIRHREALHVHQRHDLVVVVQRGHGRLQLGAQTLRLTKGSVVMIPRGLPHAFVNESRHPAAALAIFTPPFDGTDSLPVTEGQ